MYIDEVDKISRKVRVTSWGIYRVIVVLVVAIERDAAEVVIVIYK